MSLSGDRLAAFTCILTARCAALRAAVFSLLVATAGLADEPPGKDSPPAPVSVDQVVAAATKEADAIGLLRQLPAELPEEAAAQLRTLDKRLDGGSSPETAALAREILMTLGRSGASRSLAHLHEVFESRPERRGDVALGIARFAREHRRRAEDWRLLVRSLPILDGAAATEVLRVLAAFSERGTKPEWQRQVILAGRRADADGPAAAEQLLQHWVGQSPRRGNGKGDGKSASEGLNAWRDWFVDRYPELPPPDLPVDPPHAKYVLAKVLALANPAKTAGANPAAGAVVFEKAQCVKCHRFGSRGEAMGPDLTSTRQRYQRVEMANAILYPSYSIPEEYATTVVVTRDGKVWPGIVAANGDKVLVLGSNGEKTALDRREIEETQASNLSAMPVGLLEPLSPTEITDLFAYLYQP